MFPSYGDVKRCTSAGCGDCQDWQEQAAAAHLKQNRSVTIGLEVDSNFILFGSRVHVLHLHERMSQLTH